MNRSRTFGLSSSLSLGLGLLLGLALPTTGSAAVLAGETFETYATGALSGKGGGTGWTGNWGTTTANVVDTSGSSLVYAIPSGATINGQTRAVEVISTSTQISARQLATPLAQTFYVGYLVRYQAGAGYGGNNTFTLHLGTDAATTTTLNFGPRGAQAVIRHGTGTPVAGATTNVTFGVGANFYVVLKVNWNGSAFTSANLWLNPTATDNTATPNGVASLSGFSQSTVTHVFFRHAALETDDVLRADEIKIGTTWNDVMGGTPPPVITLHPQSRTNCVGTAATFTSAATGNPTPTVQWQVSTNAGGAWTNVSGAISTTYSPATVMGNHGNLYRAVFSNAGGSTNSSAAMLTVNAGPVAVNFSTNAAPNQLRVIPIAGLLATCTALDGNAFYLSGVAPLSTNGASVAITATNTINYQPRAGFTGADRFNYTITDRFGCSATAAVQVNVGP